MDDRKRPAKEDDEPDVVIASAIHEGGDARSTVVQDLQGLRRSFTPSPLRLLRLVNGKRCKNPGCSETNSSSGSSSRTESPAHEEEETAKKSVLNDPDDQDWTPSERGGFLPKLTRIFKRPKNSAQHQTETTKKKPIIHEILTLAQYKAVVVDEPHYELVVVRFHAPWWHASRAVQPKFQQLAAKYHSTVKFVQVETLTKKQARIQGLSVSFAHIYHKEAGLVEERKLNKRSIQEFERILQTYVNHPLVAAKAV